MTATGYPLTASPGEFGAISIRRTVNDEIARMGATFHAAITGGFEFVCECGDLRCKRIVNMTLADYAKTRPGSVVSHDNPGT